MKVLGIEILDHVIDHALLGVDHRAGFTLAQMRTAITAAGGPYPAEVADRAADRVLQRLKRQGAIFTQGGKWFAVTSEEKTP